MACKECENINNYNCGCDTTDYCDCKIKLSTVCVLYNGVTLTLLDTYDGQNLESILKKVDELFIEIFDIIQSSLYKNIGNGAKVFKKINSANQAEFRTLISNSSINIIENLDDIGIYINETWLYDFIVNSDAETTTNISETVIGKKIAKYTNEDGISQIINETVTTLVDNNNGSFTYTNEQGVPITISSNDVLTSISNTIVGHRIATYKDEASNNKDINESITVLTNIGNNTLTYKNEAGVTSSYIPMTSTVVNKGIVELATDVETQTGTDQDRAVTPYGLSARTANETRTGILEVATQIEANALALDDKIITPKKIPISSDSQKGIVQKATQSEVNSGTDDTKFVSPSTLKNTLGTFIKTTNVVRSSWTKNYGYANIPHNIGTAPLTYMVHLRCKSANNGYSIGDITKINSSHIDQDGSNDKDNGIGIEFSNSTTFDMYIHDEVYVPIKTGTQDGSNAVSVSPSQWNIEVLFFHV